MRTKLLSIFFAIIGVYSFSQQTTYQKTFNWADDMIPMNMFYSNSNLYIPILEYDENDIGFTNIYKINENGDISDSIQLSSGLYCWIYQIQENGDGLIAFGSTYESSIGPVKLVIYSLTNDLELVSATEYETSYGGFNRMFGFVKNNNNHVIIGNLSNDPENPQSYNNDIYLAEINPMSELVFDTLYQQSGSQTPYGVDYSEYSNSLHLYTLYSFDPSFQHQIQYNVIKSSYQIDYTSTIVDPVHFNSNATIKIIDENFLYHAGDIVHSAPPAPLYEAYGIYKFNYDYEIQNSLIINYNNDTTNSAAQIKCFDYVNEDELYFLGTKNYSYDDNSFMELIKIDQDLNILWRRYYGGERNYMSEEVKACDNGGCIISAKVKNDEGNRHTILMKVDEEGLITSTNNNANIPIKNAIALPNPGKEYLELHTGMHPATLQLYNLSGSLVLEEAINSNVSRINTLELSSGTYIWSLVKEGNVVETGKWIRE